MQEDAVEVSFCDLCGTSVPAIDLTSGAAVRHQGKTVGACCLSALRGDPVATVLPTVRAASGAGYESRILPVAIVLLAAIAAATMFLDQRLTSADTMQRQRLEQLAEAQTSDSQVLAALAVAMDTVPRRPDLDALVTKVGEVATGATDANASMAKQLQTVADDVAAIGKEQKSLVAQSIDYRPLIEDLRQRQLRLVELVTTMRAVAPVTDAPPPAPAQPAPAAAGGAPSLPAALAESVKKLQAADPAVRFEAVDELLRSKEPAVLPHVLPLARDPDSFVRRLTVEGLGGFKRSEAVEALLTALTDTDEYVRDTAWRSLKEVTGQKIPFDGSGSKDARARAVQKWQEWWDKNKASFGT